MKLPVLSPATVRSACLFSGLMLGGGLLSLAGHGLRPGRAADAPLPAIGNANAGANADAAVGPIAASFAPFTPQVAWRADRQYFYVESNGMPDHQMMVGITAWQQQVPLPQKYVGENAWRFPLHPVPAAQPLSAKDHFFRGAIAIAANGVPIFNPIKNDGRTDTLLAGELDAMGGHCGRADDYHYHIAPLQLQKQLGTKLAVAYALDGYAIYGLTESDGSTPRDLDVFNGHTTQALGYHYHATKTYPYLNGGFHGEVTERGGQVDPQPRSEPVRPAGEPLRGARITDFVAGEPGEYTLTYKVNGQSSKIHYTAAKDGSLKFDYIDAQGRTRTETYGSRSRPRPEGRNPFLGF